MQSITAEREREVAPDRSGRSSVVSGYRGISAAFPFSVSLRFSISFPLFCPPLFILSLSYTLLSHFTILRLFCPDKKPASTRAPGCGSHFATVPAARPSVCPFVRPSKLVTFERNCLSIPVGLFKREVSDG